MKAAVLSGSAGYYTKDGISRLLAAAISAQRPRQPQVACPAAQPRRNAGLGAAVSAQRLPVNASAAGLCRVGTGQQLSGQFSCHR